MSSYVFEQNSITKEFIEQARELIERRLYDYSSLADVLHWNKSSMSLVINGNRDIPMRKWEQFKEVYKNAIESLHKGNKSENNNMDLTQELIASLKKNIEVLERNVTQQESIVQNLIRVNTELKTGVQASLKTVLDNQLTLTCLFESYLKQFASLMIDEPAQQQEFRLTLHKDAFVQVSELLRRGNAIEIDSESIVSKGA